IITGVGDRGQVGFAVARHFLAAGWRAVITARSDAVHERAAELAASGVVVAVRADLTEPHDVAVLVDTVRERYGRLDAVINVAGGLTVVKPLADTASDEWRREIERNAGTTYQVCRAVLPLLREHGGAIVNFAAVAGQRAAVNVGAYSASKAAVIALTRSLALEERPNGVRVNAIAPAMVDTDQNRRALDDAHDATFVTRQEIAEVAFFLASPASSGITGATIPVVGNALE
ncbi:MAG: SDR family NAD(P)-dependent oxidoreductase, partial [Longimicrobiales bacterium]